MHQSCGRSEARRRAGHPAEWDAQARSKGDIGHLDLIALPVLDFRPRHCGKVFAISNVTLAGLFCVFDFDGRFGRRGRRGRG